MFSEFTHGFFRKETKSQIIFCRALCVFCHVIVIIYFKLECRLGKNLQKYSFIN